MDKTPETSLNVTLQALFVLFITSWSGIRLYGVIVNWQTLREFGANPGYLFGTGLFWVLVGFWATYLLWVGQKLALPMNLAATWLYFAWYWLDRLVMQPDPAPNTLFSLITSILLLVIISINLILPISKAFFKKEQG
jgi:hypothetical protein